MSLVSVAANASGSFNPTIFSLEGIRGVVFLHKWKDVKSTFREKGNEKKGSSKPTVDVWISKRESN